MVGKSYASFQLFMFPNALIYANQNVHAIGDRANGLVLDAYEIALRNLNMTTFEGSDLRPRLEHAQVLAPKDADRLVKMGGMSKAVVLVTKFTQSNLIHLVIASVQPTHV